MRVVGVTIDGAFSGADTALFRGLDDRRCLVGEVNADIAEYQRWLALLASFRLSRKKWSRQWRQKLMKTPWAFEVRTRSVDRKLRTVPFKYDVVLQVSGLFGAFLGQYRRPVVIFCDYTTKLAERNYAPWFGLNPSSAEAWYALERTLYSQASAVCCASRNTKTSLVEDYGADEGHVHVIGEGVYDVFEHPGRDWGAGKILFVGIDFERKGGSTLLQAFREVRRRLPRATLTIVGPDAGPRIEGVSWVGHVRERARLEALFAEASLFVMPSICEPFGLVLIEAMAHGLPVIGTKVDAMSEIIVDQETGLLVRPGAPDELAEALVSLLKSPERCSEMGSRGRQRVIRHFMWSDVVDRLVNVLEGTIAQGLVGEMPIRVLRAAPSVSQ